MTMQNKPNIKVVVVANRLPLTVHINPWKDEFSVTTSSGGLVSALRGVSGMDCTWMGWPGTDVPLHIQTAVTARCREEGCFPVFLDAKTIDFFYNGFCNNILWPLFHYVPPPMDFGSADTPQEEFQYFIKANQIFTETIVRVCEDYPEDDQPYVWIHDYHLMMVPKMLRERCPKLKIGWFLHTPWPTHEVFRMLPFRTDILTGLLSCNLLAFHVYDYQRHFMQSCRNLLGLEAMADGIDATPIGESVIKCNSIPIGIEPFQFVNAIKNREVKLHIARMKKEYGEGQKIILGVDRLDYMKGIPHKLNAFDRFQELFPEWKGRCVLVQLAVPSRSAVLEYQRLKSAVHEIVGKINGKRGHLGFIPVHYLDQSLCFLELVALYRLADVAFITSLRDGMNLVAFEYVAAQKGRHGVLVLSEFAGAAQSLGAGAIRVNPWNMDECAIALHEALTMSPEDRKNRHDYCFRHVLGHTSQRWAESFIQSLVEACEESDQIRSAIPPELDMMRFVEDYRSGRSRLLMIEMMDCMIASRGQRGLMMKRFRSLQHLPEKVLKALEAIATETDTTLIISSAAPAADMDRIFGKIPAILMALKGASYRDRSYQWHELVTASSPEVEASSWMPEVIRTVEWVHKRTPGTYLEMTPHSIAWYWEDIQSEVGLAQARELMVHLWAGPLVNVAQNTVDIALGGKSIEIRPSSCSRDKLMRKIIESTKSTTYDFVACLGTYRCADESIYNMFESLLAVGSAGAAEESAAAAAALSSSSSAAGTGVGTGTGVGVGTGVGTAATAGAFYSVTVSQGLSRAKYRLSSVEKVQELMILLSSRLGED